MKRHLVLLFVFLSLFASAQITKPKAVHTWLTYDRMWIDSAFVLPSTISSFPQTGQIRYNPSDTSVYVFNGSAWVRLGGSGSGGGGIPFGSSLQYVKGDHTLGSFLTDAYTGLRPLFFPIDSTLDASRITNLLPFIRSSISVVGKGFYNSSTGVIVIDSSGSSGGSGVQSDWAQTNAASPDFIRNKPTSYTEVFTGTSVNQFTVSKTPIAASIAVFVNGQRIPKSFFSLTVNTVQINASLLTFTTDTADKIEISYQSIY